MKIKSIKNSRNIADWLDETLGDSCFVDVMEFGGHVWFNSSNLYNYLNGERLCCNIPDEHITYKMTDDEYVVCDIERQPTVYVNEIGAVKMLHNVISPVTVAIFKQVGLDRIKQIIENKALIPA